MRAGVHPIHYATERRGVQPRRDDPFKRSTECRSIELRRDDHIPDLCRRLGPPRIEPDDHLQRPWSSHLRRPQSMSLLRLGNAPPGILDFALKTVVGGVGMGAVTSSSDAKVLRRRPRHREAESRLTANCSTSRSPGTNSFPSATAPPSGNAAPRTTSPLESRALRSRRGPGRTGRCRGRVAGDRPPVRESGNRTALSRCRGNAGQPRAAWTQLGPGRRRGLTPARLGELARMVDGVSGDQCLRPIGLE